MGKKYTEIKTESCTIPAANNSPFYEETISGSLPNPAVDPVDEKTTAVSVEPLHPICPNPEQGFQPLSPCLIECMVIRVMCQMDDLCEERHTPLDMAYWKRQTRFILSPQSTKDMLVISSPAGSGKSTWIEAFTQTVVKMFREETDLASSLVGVAVVSQKVEDLNRLATVLNKDAPENLPNMVALQGWTTFGQKHGFCQNPAVSNFDECRPGSCPRSKGCELLAFREKAPKAVIVGLTQERFAMLREGGNLDGVMYRLMEDGRFQPRRYLIFDEKFPMAQISTLDKSCIDLASIEFSELIEKIAAADFQVRSLQQSLAYHVEQPFQALRRSLCVQTGLGNRDIQAGFCALPSEYTTSSRRFAFQTFSDFVLCQKKQYATRHLRTALAVMSVLYQGQPCLFSKTNGFAVTDIAPPPPQYGESQSVIFDATAEVDEDYHSLKNAAFSKGVPKRSHRCLIFHIYTHGDLNVSKRAMGSVWKIPALSQFVAGLMESTFKGEDVLLCSYKNYAEEMANSLRKSMSEEDYRHILLMPDREQDAVPYFGGTNGSNSFNTATTVFLLGYPRLNPRDYLIYACAAYGNDRLSEELNCVAPEELTSRHSGFIWNLPSVKLYMAHHLAARMEQEIYRCKLRNPGFSGEINVYFFCPPSDMMEILQKRLKPNDTVFHDELPTCVDVCKRSARRYESGQTSYGRLVQFLAGWKGTAISVQQLRSDLDISSAVWKDLMGEDRVKGLLKQYQIQRKGRGPNAVWIKPSPGLCA